MIAVILNYESRQNPAYRSTLARAFFRDLQSIRNPAWPRIDTLTSLARL
jgi:hypothetical protein